MHRLTATDTPMVRYTRTIFPSYAFENLPKLDLTNKEELRKYLTYSREPPSYIRTLSKSEIKATLNEAKSQV